MPVIAVISPKGGVGKTTAAMVLACQLARQADVVIVDADENHPVKAWAALGRQPERLKVKSEGITEDTIVDMIEASAEEADFVVVDCEGTANLTVAYAVGAADLVIVPMGGSALDANQAARGLRLVKQAEKQGRRKIAHAVLLTRTPAAVRSRTLTSIHENLRQHGVALFKTELNERDAFRALFSFGGSLDTLEPSLVGGLDKARLNARAFASEAISILKGQAGATSSPALDEVA